MKKCFCPVGLELAAGSTTNCVGETTYKYYQLVSTMRIKNFQQILMSVFVSALATKYVIIAWDHMHVLVKVATSWRT